ncbi:hypothetical protein RUM43_007019 [Polyplax serrata]|uniref:Uncharacterized protein n=1 Tax=Polyplax serrata TaxID=468196 RepID=A0AAN8PM35_POLSC
MKGGTAVSAIYRFPVRECVQCDRYDRFTTTDSKTRDHRERSPAPKSKRIELRMAKPSSHLRFKADEICRNTRDETESFISMRPTGNSERDKERERIFN